MTYGRFRLCEHIRLQNTFPVCDIWRRERDSNPRPSYPGKRLAGARTRPLCDPSDVSWSEPVSLSLHRSLALALQCLLKTAGLWETMLHPHYSMKLEPLQDCVCPRSSRGVSPEMSWVWHQGMGFFLTVGFHQFVVAHDLAGDAVSNDASPVY